MEPGFHIGGGCWGQLIDSGAFVQPFTITIKKLSIYSPILKGLANRYPSSPSYLPPYSHSPSKHRRGGRHILVQSEGSHSAVTGADSQRPTSRRRRSHVSTCKTRAHASVLLQPVGIERYVCVLLQLPFLLLYFETKTNPQRKKTSREKAA